MCGSATIGVGETLRLEAKNKSAHGLSAGLGKCGLELRERYEPTFRTCTTTVACWLASSTIGETRITSPGPA